MRGGGEAVEVYGYRTGGMAYTEACAIACYSNERFAELPVSSD